MDLYDVLKGATREYLLNYLEAAFQQSKRGIETVLTGTHTVRQKLDLSYFFSAMEKQAIACSALLGNSSAADEMRKIAERYRWLSEAENGEPKKKAEIIYPMEPNPDAYYWIALEAPERITVMAKNLVQRISGVIGKRRPEWLKSEKLRGSVSTSDDWLHYLISNLELHEPKSRYKPKISNQTDDKNEAKPEDEKLAGRIVYSGRLKAYLVQVESGNEADTLIPAIIFIRKYSDAELRYLGHFKGSVFKEVKVEDMKTEERREELEMLVEICIAQT